MTKRLYISVDQRGKALLRISEGAPDAVIQWLRGCEVALGFIDNRFAMSEHLASFQIPWLNVGKRTERRATVVVSRPAGVKPASNVVWTKQVEAHLAMLGDEVDRSYPITLSWEKAL